MAGTKEAAGKDFRAGAATLMNDTLADEAHFGDWTYIEVRPLQTPPRPWRPGTRVRGDCGKGCQYIWWWNAGPDPMGRNFDPYGNSTTICLHLQHLDTPGELEVGDVVTIGWNGDIHAAMVIEAGPDPLMWSFGHQGSPNTYRLSWDNRWPKQYCKMPVPVYVPTGDDLLRTKTGYWSWVQWKLGEGSWQHHKASDPKVRPAVPMLIPPKWWVMLAKFKKNRLKGTPIHLGTPTGIGAK